MEKRLNVKFETYITEFKHEIRDKINQLKFSEYNVALILNFGIIPEFKRKQK